MLRIIPNNYPEVEKEACKILDNDGIIVYPTDTIYGFGCNGKSEVAINKLNILKKRNGPMSVLCPNIKTAMDWMNLPDIQKSAAKKRLGGKNTVIVPVKENIVSSLILGKNGTLGIRIPQNDFCAKISKRYSGPITTTSVNHTGFTPHIDPAEINKEFKYDIDLLIDDGIINGKGSTIHLLEKGVWKVLRK